MKNPDERSNLEPLPEHIVAKQLDFIRTVHAFWTIPYFNLIGDAFSNREAVKVQLENHLLDNYVANLWRSSSKGNGGLRNSETGAGSCAANSRMEEFDASGLLDESTIRAQ